MTLSLFSPAKLNLFLYILRRRIDGYHDLASLFQAVDFGDILTFSLADTDTLTCSNPHVPCGPSNLISKAIELFRKKTGLCFHVCVHLEKQIPMQAGLGGGSSNAATTLWALNELMDCPFTTVDLLQISSEIGSDIPFFFSEGTAYCTGRGEHVQNMPALSQNDPLIIVPSSCCLCTKSMFEALDLSQCFTRDPKAHLDRFYQGALHYHNDFEAPAFKQHPLLGACKETMLQSGFEHVCLTGTGTALFGFGQGEVGRSSISANFLNRPVNQWYRNTKEDICL